MATTTGDRSTVLSELGLDKQNKATLGRLLGTGRLGHAEEAPDGRMRAEIRIPPDELIWDPSILVMPHEGDIDLELINDDLNTHCAPVVLGDTPPEARLDRPGTATTVERSRR